MGLTRTVREEEGARAAAERLLHAPLRRLPEHALIIRALAKGAREGVLRGLRGARRAIGALRLRAKGVGGGREKSA